MWQLQYSQLYNKIFNSLMHNVLYTNAVPFNVLLFYFNAWSATLIQNKQINFNLCEILILTYVHKMALRNLSTTFSVTRFIRKMLLKYSSILILENMWYSIVTVKFRRNLFGYLGTHITKNQYIAGGKH